MPTLVLDPMPAELTALLERRRQIGADRHDEMWEGVLHIGPAPLTRHAIVQAAVLRLLAEHTDPKTQLVVDAFNLGVPDNYRIPDGGVLSPNPAELYQPTAQLVLEVLSPDDETMAKLPFYAGCKVREVLIVDPSTQRVEWLGLRPDGSYEEVTQSAGTGAQSVRPAS